MTFETITELKEQGFKQVGLRVWAKTDKKTKATQLKARCYQCGCVHDIPLSALNKTSKRVVWECQLCRDGPSSFKNEQSLKI